MTKFSRREFLKRSSTAAVALSAFPWISPFGSPNNSSAPSDKVRLGFIGVGSRGRGLLMNVLALPESANYEVTAICDNYKPSYDLAMELCGDRNVQGFTDYKKMLELDLDGVVIATPLFNHAEITNDSMKSGKHVFCEKAMARTLDEIKSMYDTHLQENKILQIGHQRMFDPKYIKAIEMMRSGEIGTIGQIRAYWHRNNDWRRKVPSPELEKQINWRLYKEYSAGLLTELGSHQIQVANWVMDKPPVSVMGNGSIVYWKDGREVFDNVANIFEYDDGTQFIWDSMTSNRKYGLEEQIMGHIGTMELETNKIFMEKPPEAPGIRQLIHDMEKGLFETVPIGGATWVPETAIQYEGDYISDKFEMDETQLQLEAFINFIRKGKAPENLVKEAYNASIWTILAEEAIYRGEKLTMPEQYII